MEANWVFPGVIGVCLRSRFTANVNDPLPTISRADG
jgi:hypothetical protein